MEGEEGSRRGMNPGHPAIVVLMLKEVGSKEETPERQVMKWTERVLADPRIWGVMVVA